VHGGRMACHGALWLGKLITSLRGAGEAEGEVTYKDTESTSTLQRNPSSHHRAKDNDV
jgi:hypothetical protein